MQAHSIGGGGELLPQAGIAQQFSDFRQDFQVFLGGGFGNQQENQQENQAGVTEVETVGAGA